MNKQHTVGSGNGKHWNWRSKSIEDENEHETKMLNVRRQSKRKIYVWIAQIRKKRRIHCLRWFREGNGPSDDLGVTKLCQSKQTLSSKSNWKKDEKWNKNEMCRQTAIVFLIES